MASTTSTNSSRIVVRTPAAAIHTTLNLYSHVEIEDRGPGEYLVDVEPMPRPTRSRKPFSTAGTVGAAPLDRRGGP
jgi:hypothetical protein